ncbi:class I SAM-dependent methyltransferase [Nostoc sp. UHCC 0251]|uniref:class I SAM-dependent methyltransferase n=1 Tax=Nostoc sp. UHCC 0251 TaxID=3110240 RepID=UPI002B1FA244|nr:methyltransferase domain-containing protein [Nostoc sp. UHCC 0251]MEA5625683.1 methyltransferase domain-containing protein [Nostoc sp. UHCC 0251]
MASHYVTSSFLQVQNSKLYAVFGWSQRPKQMISSKLWLTILEIFVHEHDIEKAHNIYCSKQGAPIDEKLYLKIQNYYDSLKHSDNFVVSLLDKQINLYDSGFKGIVDLDPVIDLGVVSRETYQVLPLLFYKQQLEEDLDTVDSLKSFTQVVELMNDIGLLSPAIGAIDWGSFNRKNPICHACGFTRGTPIDRYYLSKFVEEIKDQVVGNVLEIGSVPKDREFYNFSDRPGYRVLNLEASPGVDIVGDAHDQSLIEPESYDSIIIFNVLEHCYAPWQVAQNIHSWLKVGGKCFCLVPNAQRLHDRPADYWRPLPDGLSLLFKNFARHKLYVYGNTKSVVAIFHGITVEEITKEDLDAFHPDYPVISCIVAEK